MSHQANDVQTEATHWNRLYRTGGWAALIAVVLLRRDLGAEVSLFSQQIPPRTASDWFTLLQNNPLLLWELLIARKLFQLANDMPREEAVNRVLPGIGFVILPIEPGIVVLAVISAFAHDIHKQSKTIRVPSTTGMWHQG